MNYKETLFFIAKCLTITFERRNLEKIRLILKTTKIDWEAVVKVSTSHYVFPALYCNLKRVRLLKYVPDDLVEYMKYLTDLNRDRNEQIIQQAKKLNSLLLMHDIRPIFLKGTGNLLEGLYQDIGERMVGDIDFLLSKKDLSNAIDILKNDNYYKSENLLDNFPGHRHYPRLVKQENIAAVEIHKDVIIEKYVDEFNYKMISEDAQQINDFSVLSFENQLSLSIIASHLNDYGFELKKFSLRNAYDVFLLSKKVNTKKAILNFNELKNPLNCYLANCNYVFGDLDSLKFCNTKESDLYVKEFNKSLFKKTKFNLKMYFTSITITFKRRFIIVCKSIFNAENRNWLIKKIKDKINI